jgi:outer membrane protein
MKRTNTFFMKTGLLTAVMVVLTISLSRAQTDSSFTLQQCIDYALKNNVNVRNAELDAQISKAKIGEVRSAGLPQINGTAQVVDNPALRRLFLKYDPKTPGPFDSYFPPGTAPGVYGVPQLFQQRTSEDASLTASQLLFSGSYLIGLRAAKVLVELSSMSTLQSKVLTTESVTKAYYLVLINRERTKLLDANISRVDSLLKQTSISNQQGFVEKIDVDRLSVTYNNLVTERQKFTNIIELSMLVLKFQMGYDVNTPINLKGDISELNSIIANYTTFNSSNLNYNNRPEYKLLLTQKKMEYFNLKNIRSGYTPTLSAFGTTGYYSANTGIVNTVKSRAYQYTLWGVTLNVPVFDGFNKYYRAQQSKLAITKMDNSIANFEQAANLQVKQNELSLMNNIKTSEIQKKNLDLAKEISRVTKVKYQQGIGSNIEVIVAETSYKEAQTNYYNALYDLMVSQIDYQKSLGTLYQGK